MKKQLLLLIAPFCFISASANEMTTTTWNFPTPDQIQVSQNRVMLFCDANPSKCPVGLAKNKYGMGGATGDGSLVDTNTTTSANNLSVVLAGNNSSVVLNTSQDADDNNMSSDSETDANIDYDHDEVLNINNN